MKYWSGMIMENKDVLEFYKQTSQFTDLGYYKEFTKNLPNNIEELCVLQRMQIIHPVAYNDSNIRNKSNCFWGDMTKMPITRLDYEEDYFPTAQSIIAELLRKNPNYNIKREAKDKINITCRGQAILLASILKAKGIPARARSGFAPYIKYDGISYDHWITEYYDENENIWKLVDADEHCPDHEMGFDLNNIPYNRFIFGANAYLGLREKSINPESILYSSNPVTLGMKAALRGLFYDFHALMNNEIIFLHVPKYIKERKFNLSEDEYTELDNLARLMLDPNKNFKKLKCIWESNLKYRILCGALNG